MTPKLESIKHLGDMVDGKMVCREDCPSVTHRNTPDTEAEAEDDGLSDFVSRIRNAVNYKGSDDHEDVRSILKDYATSRDTYWKERIEGMKGAHICKWKPEHVHSDCPEVNFAQRKKHVYRNK